jgi:hypothetical protein
VNNEPSEILRGGCAVLDPLLRKYGFSYADGDAGSGSGGPYATGAYTNGDRRLELSFRYSLGLVTYHFRGVSIDHETYMRFAPGAGNRHRYPGFSDDSLTSFQDLACDLENFAISFLHGDFAEFLRCANAAANWKKLPGLAKLS